MTTDAGQIIGLHQRHAGAFARDRNHLLFEAAWLDRFCRLLPAGAAVLDVGCGFGKPIARYLVEQGCLVTGIDSSPKLIAICQARLPAHDWQTADMRTLCLAQTFAGIIAWDSFFHLCPDDQRRMFPVFRKHAAPRAVLEQYWFRLLYLNQRFAFLNNILERDWCIYQHLSRSRLRTH